MKVHKDYVSEERIRELSDLLAELKERKTKDGEIYPIHEQLYSGVILELLHERPFNAVYWMPYCFPFSAGMQRPTFAKEGRWKIVDKENIKDDKHTRKIYNSMPDHEFIQADLNIITPQLPQGITRASQDFSFFNEDWPGTSVTYVASDLALRIGGILMTKAENAETVEKAYYGRYSLMIDLEIQYPHYALFRKNKIGFTELVPREEPAKASLFNSG